jgi:signal peptidase I
VLKRIRLLLELALVLLVVGGLGIVAAVQAAPLAGYSLYAVRSASMAPAIAVGELVVAQHVEPGEIRAGDVITVKVASGATVTHRVVGLTAGDHRTLFTTRGDANPSADPVPAPAEQVRGRVAAQVPLLGFLLAMVTMPSGILAMFSIGAMLLTTLWLLDEQEAEEAEELELERLAHALDGGQAAVP